MRLEEVVSDKKASLYQIVSDNSEAGNPETGNLAKLREYVVSTPETRDICNDPFLVGCEYTDRLRQSCEKTFNLLNSSKLCALTESQTCVLNILRGGLNFGLRESLRDAFSWNRHASAFISAQRARSSDNPEDWHITESAYKKVYYPENVQLVIGDVVATGTSLKYALKLMVKEAKNQGISISSIIFFTIGSWKTSEILQEIDEDCRREFPLYSGASVIYFEGRFDFPVVDTPLNIKITGTDLLRTGASLMAPEFIESQYKNPAFPLERCTIYDAGSRAFWLPEYLEDVREYWTEVKKLADSGVSFEEYLKERCPLMKSAPFGKVSLEALAEEQIGKAESGGA